MAYPVQWRAPAAQAYLNPRQHAAHAHPHALGHAIQGQTMPGSAQRPASRPVPQPAPQPAPHPLAVAHQPQHAPQLVPQPAAQLAPSSGGLAPRTLPSLDGSGAPRPPGMNGAARVPMLQQPGITQQMLASQVAQVSRPVAVQMARLPSQASLDTQLSRTASRPRILQDFSQFLALSTEQLVQLCRSLQNQCETNKQILAEKVKEQGKLLTEREVLRRRKADLERTLEGPGGQDGLSSSATPVPAATESGAAACEVLSAAEPEATIPAAAQPAQPFQASTEETVANDATVGTVGSILGEQGQQVELPSPPTDNQQIQVASEDGHQVEQISLASPAPLLSNPEAVHSLHSPDVAAVSTPATATTACQLISEEISLASPMRPAEPQIFAVPLGSPKVFNPPEVVTLASPIQGEACHVANTTNLGTPEAKCLEARVSPLQPDLASGRPVASPMSPSVIKVKDATSPETLSATTLVADTPPEDGKVNGVPCSGDAAAGVGAKSEQDQIKVLSPSYGSLDGSSVLPDCETMGQDKSAEAKLPFLSAPEELMARVEDASIRLTWFFDEEMLEQFAAGPAEMSFQIRQQSEGVGGRLRIREHSSPAFYSAKDGAVQAQSFLIEGCAPGRPYTFSIRCRLQLSGAEARVSDFCESVTACVPAATSTTKAPPSLCSTAASVDAKGMLEEASVAPRRLPVAAAILAAQAASATDRLVRTVQPLTVEQPVLSPSQGQPVLVPTPVEQPSVPVQPAPVQPALLVQPVPMEQSVLPAQPAPVEQPAPAAQPAPVEQLAAAAQLAGTEPPVPASPVSVDQPVQAVQGLPDVPPIQASAPPAEGRRIVPKVSQVEAARPVEVISAPEASSRFLPDDGCNLRKWLQDYKGLEATRDSPVRPMEISNGRVPQVEVGQGSEDQSYLRQWLQNRQAPHAASTGPSLRGQVAARISTAEMDATRVTEQDVRLQVGDWSRYDEPGPASSRLQSVPGQDMRQLEMQPPSSFQIPDFRHSSFAPFSTQGDLRPPGAILGNARSKSFGGVERRATMMPKLESRHADLSPGRGTGDSIRIVTAMTPNGHGLVAPLPAHLSGGFGGSTPVSRQGPDPVTMGNALTTINSLPQPHASWARGQQIQTDAFQTHGLNQQQALFGQPSIVASNFFSPINDNLFGPSSSALGSTRPFSHFPSGPVSGADSLFKPAAVGMAMSAFPEEESRQFDPPPPPRSAPSLQYQEDPPRRDPVIPAWDEPPQGFGVTQNVNPVSSIRSQGRRSELKVRMSDNHWESLRFSSGDDLDWAAQQFVSRCGLKSAFLPGVVERLKQMVNIQQDYACVDVVDLI